MNSKNAKRLRRVAEQLTVGKPRVAYKVQRRGAHSVQIWVDQNSTRGYYLALKKVAEHMRLRKHA